MSATTIPAPRDPVMVTRDDGCDLPPDAADLVARIIHENHIQLAAARRVLSAAVHDQTCPDRAYRTLPLSTVGVCGECENLVDITPGGAS